MEGHSPKNLPKGAAAKLTSDLVFTALLIQWHNKAGKGTLQVCLTKGDGAGEKILYVSLQNDLKKSVCLLFSPSSTLHPDKGLQKLLSYLNFPLWWLSLLCLPPCILSPAWSRELISGQDPGTQWNSNPGRRAEHPSRFSPAHTGHRWKAPGTEFSLRIMTWQQTLIKWNLIPECLLMFTSLQFQSWTAGWNLLWLQSAQSIAFWNEHFLAGFPRIASFNLQSKFHYVCKPASSDSWTSQTQKGQHMPNLPKGAIREMTFFWKGTFFFYHLPFLTIFAPTMEPATFNFSQ